MSRTFVLEVTVPDESDPDGNGPFILEELHIAQRRIRTLMGGRPWISVVDEGRFTLRAPKAK